MKLRNYTIYIVAFLFCACSPSYTLQSYEEKVVEIKAIEDSAILTIIAPYQNAIEEEMQEVPCARGGRGRVSSGFRGAA